MRKFGFYPRLALTNLRGNRQTYAPYLLTCTLCVMTFYIICAISANHSFAALPGAVYVQMVMIQGVLIIAIFAAVLIFYTNGFLIRRRKRELALYNTLGMEKRHLACMMLWEALYTSLFSILGGIALGVLFSRVLFLILLRMLHLGQSVAFAPSPGSMGLTAGLFCCIFLLTLVTNLRQVRTASPAQLMRAGQEGDADPKTNWPLAVFGLFCLGGGYAIALTVKSPIAAILLFFVAVMLVILGTYALFTAGSVAVLKALRRNKNFYYQPRHFISVSGLIHRMRQNAKGLASICILSTMVILTVSVTLSLYLGQEGMMRSQYGQEVTVYFRPGEGGPDADWVNALVDRLAAGAGVQPTGRHTYRYASFTVQWAGGVLSPQQDLGPQAPIAGLVVLPLEDYNAMTGGQRTLAPGQALLYFGNIDYGSGTAALGEHLWYVEQLKSFPLQANSSPNIGYVNDLYLVVPTAEEALHIAHQYGHNESDLLRGACSFDLAGDEGARLQFSDLLRQEVLPLEGVSMTSIHLARQEWYSLYGGFFFLGIFMGILFLMATILIIYYKQLSEGLDDRGRFLILQQVGMSQQEVRATIHSQIMTVFFLPLAVALLHTAFAFPVMRAILSAFGLNDPLLFFLCTLGVALCFAALYLGAYLLTARTYYRLVGRRV